ncbi:MAG: hypothetical protein ABIO55_13135 [Ginsengibacter sp.]
MKNNNATKFLTVKLIILFLLLNIVFWGCKKGGLISDERRQSLFEENIIGENFIVTLATDNGTDITGNYSGYTFVLGKTDLYSGPLQAQKNGITSTGSWSANDDYSKLIITLPATPAEFVFLSRSWRFTSKSATLLKLAPWGSAEALVLYMAHQ